EPRIGALEHDRLALYGQGRERTAAQWRAIYRQLVTGGYVSVDVDGHGGLRLTERARPLLRG
ncbi:MAG TPA: hypothetical protein DCZ11_02790, partial [Gammaproteobacteria bacterium]|nr:hypothetical protein [Gammaproteobacteria bacterium]MCH77351.1 hypothetical protein [Gammaproteobacteria bacterium]